MAFFRAMYGNEPSVWNDDLSGMTRLRVITNYFTRMRYCTSESELDLISKGPEPIPDVFAVKKVAPWFQSSQPTDKRRNDSLWTLGVARGCSMTPNIIGLDTGCVWGRTLTFYELETGRRYSCNCS